MVAMGWASTTKCFDGWCGFGVEECLNCIEIIREYDEYERSI